jgi:hypothetical protein
MVEAPVVKGCSFWHNAGRWRDCDAAAAFPSIVDAKDEANCPKTHNPMPDFA